MAMRAYAFIVLALFAVGASASAQPGPTTPIASGIARTSFDCVSFAAGRLDCLLLSRSKTLLWTTYSAGRWSKVQSLGGRLAGSPSCVVRGPLGLNCFAIQDNGALGHIAMNGGKWGPWRFLGGALALGRPSCLAPLRDNLVCFARTRTGDLAIKAWYGDPIWQDWRIVAADLASDPSCVILGRARTACFWRRRDGRFSAWLPSDTGPISTILTLPQNIGAPSCAGLGGDRVLCVARDARGQVVEWRGRAVLGQAGVDEFRLSNELLASDPVCTGQGIGVSCLFLTTTGQAQRREPQALGWSQPVSIGAFDAGALGQCTQMQDQRVACVLVNAQGVLSAAFSGSATPALTVPSNVFSANDVAIVPPGPTPILEIKPPPPAAPVAAVRAPIATVSVREPLGPWYVFEPRTGLACEITLYDAPAQPYFSLSRGAQCGALSSMSGVDRWSREEQAIYLRNRRGQVFFRFFEAGPSALRARWRRDDMVMLARDPRAFSGNAEAPSSGQPPPVTPPLASPAAQDRGFVGIWLISGRGETQCLVRLRIDPDTAATVAQSDGCSRALSRVNGWFVSNGAIVLTREGDAVARFAPGARDIWRGRINGGRRVLTMIRQ